MKSIYFLAICLAITGRVAAQPTLSFIPAVVYQISEPDDFKVPAYAGLVNLEPVEKNIHWERTTIAITPGCSTAVISPVLSHAPFVSSGTFPLPASDSTVMGVYMINPGLIPHCAIIKIKLTNLANPADTISALYYFNDCAVLGTNDAQPAVQVALYPNPVSSIFNLKNAGAVQALTLYAMDGRALLQLSATPNHTYDLAGQPAGTYLLALEDREGRIFQVLESL